MRLYLLEDKIARRRVGETLHGRSRPKQHIAPRLYNPQVETLFVLASSYVQLGEHRMHGEHSGATGLRLFYSYAHEDHELQEEVKKYLRMLEREGLIVGWDDRMIGAGSEWDGQILEALERADVILLLISADFLASDYCWDVEMKRALVRHNAREALVIPVILRPCSWMNAPFARLQCLPREARPVVLWDPREQGYLDVAEGLRRALVKQTDSASTQASGEGMQASRVTGEAIGRLVPVGSATDKEVNACRVLDAAIGRVIPVGRSTDVVAMVRTIHSDGLRAILEVEANYTPSPEDVKALSFEMTFPRTPAGVVMPAQVVLRLESSDCDPPAQEKMINIPQNADSRTFAFLVTPKRQGRVALTIEVRQGGISLVQQLLHSEARLDLSRRSFQPYLVASSDYRYRREPSDYTRTFGFDDFKLPVPTRDAEPTPEPPRESARNRAPSAGCFVATAAYGSSFEPSVEYLRLFRDRRLLRGRSRQLFEPVFRVYGRVGPSIASVVHRQPWLKYALRYALIWPLVRLLRVGERIGWFSLRHGSREDERGR
jgi:hypothetical protein